MATLRQRLGRPALDAEAEGLVEQGRARLRARLGGRERITTLVVGGAFFSVAIPLATIPSSDRSPGALTYILLVVAYAVASRVLFEVGAGLALPTQLVLVPMFFLVPVGDVPLLVAAGLLLGELLADVRKGVPLERAIVLPAFAWHAVGPALVLLAWGESLRWSDWPIYLAALAAQFLFDYVSAAVREWFALGVSPKAHLRFAAWICGVDTALAPIGLLAAFASQSWHYAFLLVLPLAGVLALFAGQRRLRIDHALALGNAYRGTAFLLGDVIAADDAYTGSHSREVVRLVQSVAHELGLDQNAMRDAEFAALLHDVGKIKIPSEVINKPGPLDEEEWDLVRRHTIEGEEMLARVGGLLEDVGRIVRSCHERYDGSGYPDGLAGEDIPLIARIIACCDAFSAMTNDRAYRAARSADVAIAELQAESGAQFDPRVVQSLLGVLARADLPEPLPALA